MKPTSIFTFGIISLLVISPNLRAQDKNTEDEIQALELQLAKEQEKLNERRRDLELRKLQLKLLNEGRQLPPEADLSPQERAAQLARLQAHAAAEQSRSAWIAETATLKESLAKLNKGNDRIGAPKAFGPKAKAAEAATLQLKQQTEARLKVVQSAILNSMQTTLAQRGGLNDAEFEWLQTQVVEADKSTDKIDQAAHSLMEAILKMEKVRRDPHSEVKK